MENLAKIVIGLFAQARYTSESLIDGFVGGGRRLRCVNPENYWTLRHLYNLNQVSPTGPTAFFTKVFAGQKFTGEPLTQRSTYKNGPSYDEIRDFNGENQQASSRAT